MGHHEDGGPRVAVHVLQGGQEHLGRVAVQGAGGLSARTSLGWLMMARAQAHRCFCPPET